MAVAALAAAATAGAQSGDRPKPTSCAGLTFEDPPGDQKIGVSVATVGGQPVPPPSPQPAKNNMDVRAGFFRYVDGVLTANIQVTDLNKELEDGSNGARWYFYFTVGELTRFVRAGVDDAGEVDFAYGALSPSEDQPGNVDQGDTTGRLYEGADGIVSIVVPVGEMQLAGETLGSPNAQSKPSFSEPATGRGIVPTADTGPDDGVGADFTVEPCAVEGKATQATKSQTPANDQRSGGGGGGSGGGGATGGGDSTTPGGPVGGGVQALRLRVKAGRISARKSRRRLSVRLLPGETIKGLRATLYTGKAQRPRVFATGRIATLKKARKLTLKVKRKLKKGTYTLALTGRNAAGQTSTVAVRLRVRK